MFDTFYLYCNLIIPGHVTANHRIGRTGQYSLLTLYTVHSKQYTCTLYLDIDTDCTLMAANIHVNETREDPI